MGDWYNGGTIAVENGSASVVGTTTLFNTKIKIGDSLVTLQSDVLRINQVTAIDDDNNLTIDPVWAGTTDSGLSYNVIPTSRLWGEVSTAARDLSNFLASQATFFPTDGKPSDDEGGDGSFAVDPNSAPPKLYVKSAGSWDDGTSLGGPTGATGAGYGGTSTDSKTLATTGSMAFNTQTGLAWQSGNRIRVSSAAAVATKWMEGVITDYSAGVLTITIEKQGSGSGSASDWKFGPAGEPGVKGDTPKFSGTSTDSKTIATGPLTVATQSDLAFAIGSRVTLASAANSANFMSGLVNAYSAGSMTVNIDFVGGSGTFSDWVITLVGARGATGATGLGYGGTSTTSRAINNTGTMTWTIGTGKAYQVGDLVKAVVTSDDTQWMKGIVSGYTAGVLSVDINEKGPDSTGTFASWNIGLAGETGEQGIQGDQGDPGTPGSIFVATSTDTLTSATGSKAFTVAADLGFTSGQLVKAVSASSADNWMKGPVDSYSGTTLTLNVTEIGPSPASASDWNIALAGETGSQGPAGGITGLDATKGNIATADGTTFGVLAAGSDGSILQADATQSKGLIYRSAGEALSAGSRAITDVASASTCNIGAAATDYVNITGTTTITSFGTSANKIRRVRFAGALTLTYNGTSLILPGLANIITVSGDEAEFVSDSSGNWKCTRYLRGNGRSFLVTPSFSASKSADQTGISSGVLTQITFDTEVFDAGNYFSSSAWTPPAGLVEITAALNLGGTVSVGNLGAIAIYKNGTAYRRTNVPSLGGANQQAFPSITILERANGTDVYTIYGLLTTNSGTVTASAAIGTFFQGAWLAP